MFINCCAFLFACSHTCTRASEDSLLAFIVPRKEVYTLHITLIVYIWKSLVCRIGNQKLFHEVKNTVSSESRGHKKKWIYTNEIYVKNFISSVLFFALFFLTFSFLFSLLFFLKFKFSERPYLKKLWWSLGKSFTYIGLYSEIFRNIPVTNIN